MIKRLNLKRIVALVLSLSVTVSTLFVVLASAEIGDYGSANGSIKDEFGTSDNSVLVYDDSASKLDDDQIININENTIDYNGRENLLNNANNEFIAFNASGFPCASSESVLGISDGTISNIDLSADGNVADIIFDIGSIADFEYFVMVNRSEKQFQIYSYEVYAEDSYEAIRNSSNPIIEYERNDKSETDKQINIFKITNTNSKRYIKVRIIKANYSFDNMIRICEVALLGSKTSDLSSNVLTESDKTDCPTLNALDANETIIEFCGSAVNVDNYQYLDNGNANDEFFVNRTFADYDANNNQVKWYTNGERYLDIVYDLGKPMDISGVLLISHSNLYLRSGRYKLYVGDKADNIFEKGKLIYDFINKSGSRTQRYNLENTTEEYIGRYVGLRILNPVNDNGTADITKVSTTQNNIYTRLCEFKVYGTVIPGSEDVAQLIYNGDLSGADSVNVISFDGDKINHSSINLLTDKNFDFTSYHDTGDSKKIYVNNRENLIDASLNHGNSTDVMTSDYLDITFYLEDLVQPEHLVVLNREEIEFQTFKYQIYGAEEYKELDSDGSFLGTYTRNSDSTRDCTANIFKFEKEVKIKYLRIRIIKTNEKFDSTARLQEVMLLGKVVTDNQHGKLLEDNNLDLPVFDSQLMVKQQNFMKKDAEGSEGSAEVYDVQYMRDGSIEGEAVEATRFAEYENNSVKWYTDGSVYASFAYDFGSEAEITNINIMNHQNLYLRTGHYKLYASNKYNDLYRDENLIFEYKNEGKFRRQLYTFDKGELKARYIGLKVFDPVSDHGNKTVTVVTENKASNNIYTRLCEFNVFGRYTDQDYLNMPDVTSIFEQSTGQDMMTDEEFAEIGKSIISGQKATVKVKNVRRNDIEKLVDPITDGKLDIHADLTEPTVIDGSKYLDLIYKLDDGETIYDISGFAYMGLNRCSTEHITGWYQAYMATDMDELFLQENRVFEYNYENDGYARGHIVTFKENSIRKACYFAIRILNPVCSEDASLPYARVSEIALYGEKATIIKKPINLAANMPIEAYLSNESGKFTKVTESNLSVKEIKNLTDENPNTTAKIKTSGEDLDLFYNLCSDVKIDEISVVGVKNANGKFDNVKIFASDDYNKLWSDEALVYTYKSNDPKDTHTRKFNVSKSLRYVRVLIKNTNAKDCFELSGINVIGTDDQILKYKNLANGMLMDNISVYEKSFEDGRVQYENLAEWRINGLFDADIHTASTVYGAEVGESSLNILIYLGDLRNISALQLRFITKFPEYQPIGMKAYIGETINEVEDENAVPDIVFDKMPNDGIYEAEFTPTLARYILLTFDEGNPELADIYDTINVAFTEIRIFGTSVKGMQRDEDNDTLLKYVDKETGLKWEIVRYDVNDIYTEIASAKLEKVSITDGQKESVESYTQYKINGKNGYQIKFYDRVGNEITEFGNRKLRILLPVETISEAYSTYIVSLNADDTIAYLSTEGDSVNSQNYCVATIDDFADLKFAIVEYDTSKDNFAGTDDTPNMEDTNLETEQNGWGDFENSETAQNNWNDSEGSPETGEKSAANNMIFSLFIVSSALVCIAKKRKTI